MATNNQEIIDKLIALKEKSKDVSETSNSWGQIRKGRFDAWRASVLTLIRSYNLDVPDLIESIQKLKGTIDTDIDGMIHHIDALIEALQSGFLQTEVNDTPDYDAVLENIFTKFHKIARQLKTRHAQRSTLEISDEYDVQDLLHALLLLYFDDVRPEEWTPSYAGGAVRADFLLKECKIFIEVKKTRPSMTPKILGEELIVDREKYKSHPDCEKLYCFVYDPEGHLGNPAGIIRDLEEGQEDFIKVFICPE